MTFECDKCGKKFNRKYNLDVHYKRKFNCIKSEITIVNDIVNKELTIHNNIQLTPTNCLNSPNCDEITLNNFEPPNNYIPITTINFDNFQNCTPEIISNDSQDILDNTQNITNESEVIKNSSSDRKKIRQCPKCFKIFSRHNVLQKHMESTCKGQIVKKTQCDYCLHVFSNPTNLRIHNEKGCKKRPLNNHINMDFIDSDDSDDSDDSENNKNNENINVNELLKELKTLKEENEKLKSQKEPPITTVTNTNNINNTNNNNSNNTTINNTINNTQNITNNTQNIILVEFGKEKINEVLTHEEKIKIFERGFNSVTVLTKQIHFNEKIPQYNNCYISNRRDNVAIVYDGTGWGAIDVADVVQTLIDNGKCYLETEYNESKEKYDTTENNKDKNKILSEKAITQFSRYLDKKDDKELKKRYDKETKLMMYNNRNVVMKNKKCLNNK